MTTDQKLIALILTEIRETKSQAWIARTLCERILLRLGEDDTELRELVAHLKAEANSTFLKEQSARLERLFADDPDLLRDVFDLN